MENLLHSILEPLISAISYRSSRESEKEQSEKLPVKDSNSDEDSQPTVVKEVFISEELFERYYEVIDVNEEQTS